MAKGFASAEVQAKAQATRKRKARAAHDGHNPSRQPRESASVGLDGIVGRPDDLSETK